MSDQPQVPPDAGDPDAAPPTGNGAPSLEQSFREVGDAGRATLDSAKHTGRALRQLVSADLAMARSAFGRGLAWAGVAIVFGASAWLLLAGAIIALLQRFGFSWFQAMAFTAIASMAVTAVAAWRVSYFFDHTGLHATRRQLARMGLIDEHGDDDDKHDEAEPPR